MNRELLKIKEYMFLLSAQTVSNLGDWLNIVALMALIGLKWEASPLAVSGAMLCLVVPSIFVGSFAGTIADRFDRKMLMIAADVLRAVVVIGVVFSSQLWQVYALLCIKTIFSALFEPAKEGKLKEIVNDDLMQPAVATSELVNNGAKIVGPILSGIFVAVVGIQWSFYLDSLSFLLSALLLIGVPFTVKTAPEVVEHNKKKGSFFKQFIDGFAFLKTNPSLLVGLIVFSLVILFLQISDSQLIILLREVPGQPIYILGYSMAASGAGMVIAALILNKKEIRFFLRVLSFSGICLGVAFILLGSMVHLPVLWITILWPLLAFFMGFSFDMALIPFNVMAQKRTPENMTGRVFGTIGSVVTLASVIGMISGGVISETLGVIWTFILGGSVLAAVGIIVYIVRNRFEGGRRYAESHTGTSRNAEG